MSKIALRWLENRGRNGWDVPSRLLEGQVQEAFNITLERGTLGRKRYGATDVPIGGVAWSGASALIKFVPGQNDAAAELFIVTLQDSPVKILRVAGGTAAVNLALLDAVESQIVGARGAVLNGKLFLAYDSPANRLHVYNPLLGPVIHRVGLPPPGAPAVANGGGAGVAVTRYYRVQWRYTVGGVLQKQSNLGAAAGFTPGANGALVTQPAPPVAVDTLTEWVVWGSIDNLNFFKVSGNLPIGTTTYLDNVAPASYASNQAAPEEGAYTPWPSVKYLLSDGERLLGFGVWESAAGDAHPPKDGRVYFSPVLDTTAVGYADEERVSNSQTFKGWIDIARNAGGEDRCLVGPLDGQIFVGQSRGIYLLIPTGSAQQPYRRVTLTKERGVVSQESTFMGEDENGRACIYFLDPERGPYRYGANGLEWLGADLQDVWKDFNASAVYKPALGLYQWPERRCLWMIATLGSNYVTRTLWFQVDEGQRERAQGVRYGWTIGGVSMIHGAPFSMAMFADTMGATMSRREKPYVGYEVGAALARHDDPAATTDAGTPFRASVLSPAFDAEQPRAEKTLLAGDAWLDAKAAPGTFVTLKLTRNYGEDVARADVADLSPKTPTQTRIRRRFSAAALADALTFVAELGDAAAIASAAWTLDGLELVIDVSAKDGGTTGR